ncbi:MAG TPA: hypothetical protein PK619_01080 [bacterium]|nr:hypothetical protein [bacterium]HPN81019.1 hypothetical protein [bacterium]HPW39302.1 hypothetical protein [bacterium]
MSERFSRHQIEDRDDNPESLESLAETLRLKEQYLAQVKVLYQSGILENFPATKEHPTPELGIVGIDGQEYPLPSYEDILDRLSNSETKELIEKKISQGFVKLQLTPFALPLSVLIQRYKDVLLKTNRESGIKATNGETLELNEDDPLDVWDKFIQADNPQTPEDKQLEYHIQTYDRHQTKEDRGGKYKSELLQDPQNAWTISLIEDLPDLPAESEGQIISNRKQIEVDKSPQDYLKLLQTQKEYQGETGQTPEEAFTTYLTYLQQEQIAIDDYKGQGKVNLLVGNYLSGRAPLFYWSRVHCKPSLDWENYDDRNIYNGCRPAVRF